MGGRRHKVELSQRLEGAFACQIVVEDYACRVSSIPISRVIDSPPCLWSIIYRSASTRWIMYG